MSKAPVSVLFVCLGNICRSPLAEGYFRHLVSSKRLEDFLLIDSAGTGGWHAGEPPDPRSTKTAAKYGVDISNQKSRVLVPGDLQKYDYIFGMDRSNVVNIKKRAPTLSHENVHLFLEPIHGPNADVPDPYYDRLDGFETVWQLVVEAGTHWLDQICRDHAISREFHP